MQLSDFGVNKQRVALDSGVPLIVFERPNMPISLRVAFFSGSRFDPKGKEGLAHFAEHMVLSGNKNFPTKRDISAFVESLGASFNGSTSADKMDLVLDYADAADTSSMIDLLQQFLSTSLFDPITLENERGAIRAEMAGKISDPSTYIHQLWKEVAYQGNPLCRDTIGSEASLSSISRDDLLEYYNHQLISNRAIVIASGGISATELATLCNQHALFKSGSSNNFVAPPEQTSRANPILIHTYPESEQSHIAFGFKTVPESHPDYWPLFVLNRIIGGSRTARLNQRLRFELGLVYSTFSRVDEWYGLGRVVAHASCKTKDAQAVLNEIIKIFQNVADKSITQDELDHIKTYIVKAQKLRMQTSSAWVGYHVNRSLLYPNLDISLANDLTQINQVTLNHLNHVAQKYVTKVSWYLAACGGLTADDLSVNW